MILKHNYACSYYGKGLAHIGYKNRKMTKSIIKVLMKAICTSSYDKVKGLLDVVAAIVLIKDEH